MNPKTAKVVRRVVMILMGTAFTYVGAVTMLSGATTIARQVRR